MAVCAGAVFVLAGAAVINGYAIGGGATADRRLAGEHAVRRPPRAVRSWIGHGRVDDRPQRLDRIRARRTSILDFDRRALRVAGNRSSSGVARTHRFGVGTVLMAAFFVGCGPQERRVSGGVVSDAARRPSHLEGTFDRAVALVALNRVDSSLQCAEVPTRRPRVGHVSGSSTVTR